MKLYLSIDNNQYGPYELPEVLEMINQGRATYDSYCWQEGWSEWKPISAVIPPIQKSIDKRKYQTIWRRAGASFIDGIPCIFIPFLEPLLAGKAILGIFYIYFFTAYYVNYLGKYQVKYGATIGMWFMNIRIVQNNGSGINDNQAIIKLFLLSISYILSSLSTFLFWMNYNSEKLKNLSYSQRLSMNDTNIPILSYVVYFISALCVVDILTVFFDSRKRTIADMIAGTVIEKLPTSRIPFANFFK